tara:strand:+ start:3945 stop:5213 length:1269 start_codon:yes stop_codon:yes gene_type:complete
MPAISLIHTTRDSVSSTTSTSFVEVNESSALTSGKTYYVVCHALIEGSNSNQLFEWQLVDRTNSDTTLTGSHMILEPAQGTVTQSYYFVGKFTAGSGGGGLAFEQKAASGYTAKTRYLSMMLMDLDNLQDSDYFFGTDTSSTALTTTFQDFAVARPTTTASDKWLVFAFIDVDVNNVSHNVEMRLQYDSNVGGTISSKPLMSFEGEDTTEQNLWAFCRGYSMSGTSEVFTVQARIDNESGGGAHSNSTVFGIRLDAFEDSYYEYTEAETDTTSATWVELDSKSFTPTTSGDVLVFATAIFEGEQTTRKSYGRVQVDGVTSPNSQPDTYRAVNQRDGTSLLPMIYVTKYTGASGVADVVDWDVKKEATSEYGWQEYTLAIFSAEVLETAPVNYTAVATQTYNSGSVAGQTINAKSVAGEVNPE